MTNRANIAVAALAGFACFALTHVAHAQSPSPRHAEEFKNINCHLWDLDFEPKSRHVGDRIREFMVGVRCWGTPRVDLTVAYIHANGDEQVIGNRFSAQIVQGCGGCATNSEAGVNQVRATVEAQGFILKPGCYRATVTVNGKTESIKRCAVPTEIALSDVAEPVVVKSTHGTKPQEPVVVKATPGKR